MLQFDDLFEHFGHFGRYQLLVVVVVCTPFMSGSGIAYNFISAHVSHWCLVPELANLSHTEQLEAAVPLLPSGGGYSSCEVYDVDYSRWVPGDGRPENGTAVRKCEHGWVYDRSQFSETLGTEFDLVCDRSALVPLPASIFFGAAILGTLVAGILSDIFGRKKSVLLLRLLVVTGGLVTSLSPYYWLICVAKFVEGSAASAAYVNSYIMVMEIVGPRVRGAIGMVMSTIYSCVFLVVALLAYFMRHFRLLQAVLVMPDLLCVVLIALLAPEPPRWLIQNGRVTEAAAVFKKMAAFNKKAVPDDLDGMLETIEEQELQMKSDTKEASFTKLYKSKTLLMRSMAVNFHWFTSALMYFAISLNAQALSGDMYTNTALLGLVEFPANLLGFFLISWRVTGRRYTVSLSMVLAGVSSFVLVILLIYDAPGMATNVISFVGKCLITIAYNGVYVYSVEVLPTEVRNGGMGVANLFAMVGSTAAPYMGSFMQGVWLPLPSLIFGACAVVFGLFTLVLPETLGLPLCQTIAEAEHRTVKGYKSLRRKLQEKRKSLRIRNPQPLAMTSEC